MFLLDDILLAPFKGVKFIGEKLKEQAEEELLDEEGVRQRLRELYMMLETGRITQEEFEEQEKEVIARLEEIERYREGGNG